MKKSYLMIAAAVALLTACAEKDTFKDVEQDVAIGFEGKYVNKVTRAELTNDWFTTSGNKFGVYGFKASFQLFNDEEVTYNGTTWTHPTVRFWDKGSNEYSFYAYAPYGASQSFSASKTFSFASLPVIEDISADNADIAISTPITGLSYAQTIGDTHGDGRVEFEFNHILSKLAFKIKTSANPNYAEIKVTAVDIDFPSGTATWTQSGATAVTGSTTYQTYSAKDAVDNGVTDLTKFETSVFSGTTAALNSTGVEIQDATTATNKGKIFIVTPVTGAASGDGSEHVFGVKVTYNVQYKKEDPDNAGQYINDGTPEEGCIATGVIGGHATDATKQYKPIQNSSYVVTIDVNPEDIQFCVNQVKSWIDDTPREVEVK